MPQTQANPDISQIRAELQRLILEAFGENLPTMPTDVPILDLGISSLALVEGMRRVYDRFGVLVSIRRVIEGQVTIGSLALYIEDELKNAQNQKRLASVARGEWKIQREVPLAASQQHTAFLSRYSDEAHAAFNESVLVRLTGELHAPALQAAVEEAAHRYEALRTALNPEGDSLQIGAGEALEMQVSAVPSGQLDGQIAEIVAAPFESGKRLFRANLLRLSESEHVLGLTGHALALDQQALAFILDDIAALYGLFCCDLPAPEAPACLQWADYLALGETAPAKQARDQALAYWQSQLAGELPRLELPADHPRPAIKKYGGIRQSAMLDSALRDKLNAWASSSGFRPETVFLAASVIYLHRLAAVPHLMIGVESSPLYPESGLPALANIHNLLPIASQYDSSRTFEQNLAALARLLDEAEGHRHLSLSELIQHLNMPRDQSRSALFTAAFRAIDLKHLPAFADLQAEFILPPSAGARYDLELLLVSTPSGLSLACDASAELFEAPTVSRWLTGMLSLLDAALDQPFRPCGLLPMVTRSELDLVLWQWNRTDKTIPERTVFDLIHDQAVQRGGQAAVRFGGESISYTQLLERSEQLAGRLNASGVGRGARVGILLKRSIDLIPAMLAVWRLGAMYVPMDIAFPRQRLAFMLADANVQTVLTTGELLPLVDGTSAALICIDAAGNAILPADLPPASASDSAYIMFTSGSTGKPKGVEVHHRALLNLLLAVRGYLEFTPQSHMLALTTSSFDISTIELFMPLIAGGLVEVAEDGLAADGVQLAERLRASRPSHVQATPSTLKNVLTAGWRGDKDICLASAGEALSRELAEELIKRSASLWNLYGPTETTVYSAYCRVTSAPNSPVRIGRPVPNTRLYVLDAQLQPVPIGGVGELYIGGEGVSPGYWQRPELTAERFLPDPFVAGGRIYRTGDLARFNPDGDVICLGRFDDQVKIHAVRVELGEIESALRDLPGVHDAVVTSWRDPHGDIQLVAHVIPVGNVPQASELRAQLRERLPEVMIPPHFLFHENFPMTVNGKVQRAALPGPQEKPQTVTVHMPSPLVTGTEKLLAGAWASVLGVDKKIIGRDSDFIDLGGHSLMMTRLMIEIRKMFQVSFNLRELFSSPTIEKFAALVDERRQQQTSLAVVGQLPSDYRDAEWARQRMAFLTREAELPQYLAPARGLSFRPSEIKTVFLTGATGFLGAYIIAEILKTTQADLYCLVRPRRGEDARQRIENGMRQYEVWSGDDTWQYAWNTRLHIVEGDVTLPRMGLPGPLYEILARQVDAIFHGAAHVNFIYPYEALRATNVLGVHEIIQFAFHARIKPVHHLSTAAIWPMGAQHTFYERDSIDHNGLLNLGYDEAKWVGEKCLLQAAERGLPVARYRPGEVGGDSISGHCVTDHFLIASFKGFLQFGAFPQLDIDVDVAPVDYVARSMVYLAFRRKPFERAFHLTNPTRIRMSEALNFLRGLGYQFEELPFEELRDRLVRSPNFSSNALFAYQAALEEMNQVSMQLPTYDTRDTRRELEGSGITCAPADEKLFGTYFRYLRSIGFIPDPDQLNIMGGAHA